MGTNRQTDRRTLPIALPSRLTRSVTIVDVKQATCWPARRMTTQNLTMTVTWRKKNGRASLSARSFEVNSSSAPGRPSSSPTRTGLIGCSSDDILVGDWRLEPSRWGYVTMCRVNDRLVWNQIVNGNAHVPLDATCQQIGTDEVADSQFTSLLPSPLTPPSVRLSVTSRSSIAISVSVCLSFCPLAYFKNYMSKFHQILCSLYLWLGPPLTAM